MAISLLDREHTGRGITPALTAERKEGEKPIKCEIGQNMYYDICIERDKPSLARWSQSVYPSGTFPSHQDDLIHPSPHAFDPFTRP